MKTGHSGDRPRSSCVAHSVSTYLKQKLQSINSHCRKLDKEPAPSGPGQGSKPGSSAATEVAAPCGHATVLEGPCPDCGKVLGNRLRGRDFGYLVEGLRLSEAEVAGYRESRNLADTKKLCLVLDLDNTLVDSILVSHFAPEDQCSLDAGYTASNGTLFVLQELPLVTKLRPFVREFLRQAGDMFEMYVYTMGNREYASTVVHLLDPEGAYFGSRVISREFSTSSTYKSLDLVLAPESAVLILDDTEEVWPDHRKNLIPVSSYRYFDSEISPDDGVDWRMYAQKKIDEDEDGGVLSSILSVLKDVHREFFDPEHGAKGWDKRDVRKVLAGARSRVLKGCVLSFSKIVGSGSESDRLRAAAEELGAKCKAGLGSSVTHVVALGVEEESSRWAKREGKKLVSPDWLWAAYYHWQRKPEDEFSLSSES
ncbi:RNA polymerase II C-terminal domain phosphatase-like 4 [Rhodamnia argentea]|uniref:RNA polymerase II C-terminal domain phosphatase-like n=1 Tax=Rhodamnia argentea TaxID=178133 RepID=A0A8B8NIC8_9MYRT|nr:RNA polymerase II C-terminal domain phosphatase-like 4 [Rhodamnia argentea]